MKLIIAGGAIIHGIKYVWHDWSVIEATQGKVSALFQHPCWLCPEDILVEIQSPDLWANLWATPYELRRN